MSFLLASRNFQSALLGHGGAPKKMLGKDLFKKTEGGADLSNTVEIGLTTPESKETAVEKALRELRDESEAKETSEVLAGRSDVSRQDIAELQKIREQFDLPGIVQNVDEFDPFDPNAMVEVPAPVAKGKREKPPALPKGALDRTVPGEPDVFVLDDKDPDFEEVTFDDDEDFIEPADVNPTPAPRAERKGPPPITEAMLSLAPTKKRPAFTERDPGPEVAKVDNSPKARLARNFETSSKIAEKVKNMRAAGDKTAEARNQANLDARMRMHEGARNQQRADTFIADYKAQSASDAVVDTFNPPIPGANRVDVSKKAISDVQNNITKNNRGRLNNLDTLKASMGRINSENDWSGVRESVLANDSVDTSTTKTTVDLNKTTVLDAMPEGSVVDLDSTVQLDAMPEGFVDLDETVILDPIPEETTVDPDRTAQLDAIDHTSSVDMADARMAGIANRNEARYGVPDVAEIAQDFDDEPLTGEDLVTEFMNKEVLTREDLDTVREVLGQEAVDFGEDGLQNIHQRVAELKLIDRFPKSEQAALKNMLMDRLDNAKVKRLEQKFDRGEKLNIAEKLMLKKILDRQNARENARLAEVAAKEAEKAKVDAELKKANLDIGEPVVDENGFPDSDLKQRFPWLSEAGSRGLSRLREPEKPKGVLSGFVDRVKKSWLGKLFLGATLVAGVSMAAGNRESHDSSGQDGRAPASDVARVDNNLEPLVVPVGDWEARGVSPVKAKGSNFDAATSNTDAGTSDVDHDGGHTSSPDLPEKAPTPAKVTKIQNAGGSRGGSHDLPSADRVGHNSSGSPELEYQHNERIKMDHAPFEKSIQPKFEAGQNKYIAFEDGQNVLYKKVDGETMKFRFDDKGRPLSVSISIGSPDRNGNLNVNSVVNFETNGDAYLNGKINPDFNSLASQALQDFNELAQF